MRLFMFALFPCVFALLDKNRKNFVAFCSLFCSAIFCFFLAFFTFQKFYFGSDFFSIFLEIFCVQILIPALIFVIFCVFSKNDFDFKCKTFFSVIFPAFSIFLPYTAFRIFDFHDFFVCFLRPIVYFFAILSIGNLLQNFGKKNASKKKSSIIYENSRYENSRANSFQSSDFKSSKSQNFFWVLKFIFFLIFPCLLDSFRFFNIPNFVFFAAILIFCVFSILFSSPGNLFAHFLRDQVPD